MTVFFVLNAGLGSTKITSEQTEHLETVNTSNMNAGGNVNIKATDGDLNLKGTKINAVDITLDAKKNLNIEAAENKQQTTSNTSSSSWSVGGSFGLSHKGVSYFGNFNSSKGNENGDAATNTESVIDASGTLTMNSGKDTNIDGSQVKGDKVVADIKGDLNIASKQDTDNYTENNQSSGFGFSTEKVAGKSLPPGISGPINKATTTTNVNGSFSKGKTDSTYASVVDQAGIFAGKGGFDINVGKNTDLKGAVMSSDATPDKNKLSTDTLTFSNMENRAQYNSSNTGVNYNSKKYSPLDPNYKDQGFTPVAGVTASGDADSTTKTAISPGTIEIRSNPKQNLSGLSRDTTNSLNALGKIFDKTTVQEKQELANMFGEVAFNAIGDLGLKEDDPNKVALKGIVGGIMSQIAGGSFTSGATSAGFNQLIMKELSKITDPAQLQWASLIIGAAVSKLTGGDALTGGSITLSDIRNNFEKHCRTNFSFWLDNSGYIDVTLAVTNQDSALIAIADQNVDLADISVVEQLFNYVCDSGKASFEGQEFVRVQIKQGNSVVNYDINTRDVQRYGFNSLEVSPAGQEQDEFLLMLAGTDIVLGKVAGSISSSFAYDLQLFAKKLDIKQINNAATEIGVDRAAFRQYIHEVKDELGRKANQNFTYQQLLEYARELKNMIEK